MAILVLLVVVLSLLSDVFLSLENIGNVLKQSAVILASFIYHAAQRAERIPR